ncbi:MAG: alpha-ketoglutarate dehydrogenase [Pseudomonadota bacterium]
MAHQLAPTHPAEPVDPDLAETREWLEALDASIGRHGADRGQHLVRALETHLRDLGNADLTRQYSAYRNTIPLERQGPFPGQLAIEERITAILRWNALAMVARANRASPDLGGHIASYASAAEIFEVGFNHFFNAPSVSHPGDVVYYQPHSAPGVYARAFLEGRLTEEQLGHYRQELSGDGLCSYPHPWLMPEFWQFPTGSMGLGPITSIYQARFSRYVTHRGLKDLSERHVWGVFGDGEMDEPESIAALTLAAREKLDNLTFVINCNLQRLDGPVRGNGQIIQELESLFTGAGWNVIKVLWGSEWDALFARDKDNILLRRFAETVDGEYQSLGANDGDYNRSKFFERDPATAALARTMSDEEINSLKRGGHDIRKLYAAFAAAKAHKGRPTVILAKTKKGFGMGDAGESRMTAHQTKKLDIEGLVRFRDRFRLPLSDQQLEDLEFYRPAEDSSEMRYLRERRAALGGYVPARRSNSDPLPVPAIESYASFATKADGKEMSTTMAAVRMLGSLLKDKQLGPRIVPIVADEARTFGMANLFRQIGIYAPEGQLYEPEDSGSMLYYKESRDGQLLEEGITEAGAISSWIAAATSYSVNDLPLLPVYIYYSMFGFQRIGDLIWAAADQRSRGFLLGATAGRTTLGGEGLQHQDGMSHVHAAMVPNCRAYDPAFAGELAVIMDKGARRMLEERVDEFYYVTVMNENYPQPDLVPGVEDQIMKGMYRFRAVNANDERGSVRLLGSGAILREVIAASEILAEQFGIASEVFSVTSFSELAREASEIERARRLGEPVAARSSHVETLLAGKTPVIAATDYVRAYPQLIAQYVGARFVTLGTDGFGRSDTRSALRRFFEVDAASIVLAAVETLVREGTLPAEALQAALQSHGPEASGPAPWTI